MPQKSLPYNLEQDGRRKILPAQYKEVRELYSALHSLRKVAKVYGVDKRTIQFILYPERLAELQHRNRINEHWKKYYNKDEWKLTQRKFRDKKRRLGLMIIKTKARKGVNI